MSIANCAGQDKRDKLVRLVTMKHESTKRTSLQELSYTKKKKIFPSSTDERVREIVLFREVLDHQGLMSEKK